MRALLLALLALSLVASAPPRIAADSFSASMPPSALRFAAKQLGQVVTNTTTETAFTFDQSAVVPANTLSPGTVVRVSMQGVYQAGLAQAVQPRVRFGPPATAPTSRTLLVTTPAPVGGLLNAAADTSWAADTVHVVQMDGSMLSSGRLYFSTGLGTALMVLISPTNVVTGLDYTVDNVLTASAQWAAAQTANQIRATQLSVEVLKP